MILFKMWQIDRIRGGSRTAATSKMEHFVIIVNDWKLLTIITKRSILDVAAVLDPPLRMQTKSLRVISHHYNILMCHLFLIALLSFITKASNSRVTHPVDTGRKLIVHKTFRRRPGHLLNVLCMFNLCPVSTG